MALISLPLCRDKVVKEQIAELEFTGHALYTLNTHSGR